MEDNLCRCSRKEGKKKQRIDAPRDLGKLVIKKGAEAEDQPVSISARERRSESSVLGSHCLVKRSVRVNKRRYTHELVEEAETAAILVNVKRLYEIKKTSKGRSMKPNKQVK